MRTSEKKMCRRHATSHKGGMKKSTDNRVTEIGYRNHRLFVCECVPIVLMHVPVEHGFNSYGMHRLIKKGIP